MRIVAGRWRGRPLDAPRDSRVRPTSDKVREAWLAIVAADVAGARVVDLFAGSGALGIEALSRGAASCDFVERNAPSLKALGANLGRVAAGDAARVRRGDALRFAESLPAFAYDLAFADPPYATDAAERVAERWLAVPFARVLGVEHDARVTLPGGGDSRKYGTTRVTFYRVPDAEWSPGAAGVDAAGGDVARPDAAHPDPAHPDAAEPDAAGPETSGVQT